MSTHLGPFELMAPLARGGMGEVWRGRHAGQDLPVAIKVMTAEALRRPVYAAWFRNEVRSVARLNHPGITMVLDHGEIGPEAEAATRGRLVAGSPYLVMELASEGGLGPLVGASIPFRTLSRVLLAVLDALAHAHARGVVHRDIKPANVLRFGGGLLKLSDFGIAHEVDSDTPEGVIGTPQYMSPEQLTRAWRDFGPWTDLYALGCMSWQLATGRLPFRGDSWPVLRRAHLLDELPAFEPLRPVPAGFEAWMRRLLEKSPRDRFQRAADAAWALGRLGPVADDGDDLTVLVDRGGPAEVHTFSFTGELERLDPAPLETANPREALPATPPPLPETWRAPAPPPPPPRLRGAGLGLYGVRTIPLAGRVKERDELWALLRQVHATGGARLAVAHGAAGAGKSCLVDWFCRRSHELGVAEVLWVRHGREDSGIEPFRRALTHHLGCQRMSAAERRERLAARFPTWDPDDVDALTARLPPPADDLDASSRAAAPAGASSAAPDADRERFPLFVEVLRELCETRPLLLVLDDAHWGIDALRFAEHILAGQGDDPLPILILLTVQDVLAAEDAEAAATIERLLGTGRGRRIHVGPLSTTETSDLVRGLLGLEDTLAAQVEERTGGNPLFATQLVGDWVARGILEVGPSGFALREGASSNLPDDLYAVSAAQIAQVLDGLGPSDGPGSLDPPGDEARVALERAAILGRDVDEIEWQAACDIELAVATGKESTAFSKTGAQLRAEIVDRMLQLRLAEESEVGWTFVHGMLRETLERSAREAGRWEEHHRACARVLARRGDVANAERIGRHLLAAGQLDDAFDHLLIGIRVRRRSGGYREALGVIGQCESALERLGAPETDPRWGAAMVERAAIQRLQGDLDDAMRWANRAEHACRRHGWVEILAPALLEKARVSLEREEVPLAERLLEEARATARDPLLGAHVAWNLALCHFSHQDTDGGLELLDQANRAFALNGEEAGQAECLRLAARHADPDRARKLLDRALQIYRRHGVRHGVASCYNQLGELDRRQGSFTAAEDRFKRARDLFDAVGGREGDAVAPRLSLGMLYLELADYTRARRSLEEARSALLSTRKLALLGSTSVLLLAVAGAQGDWAAWEHHLHQVQHTFRRTRFGDSDTLRGALLAASSARAAGEPVRAREALGIALLLLPVAGDESTRAEVAALGAILGGASLHEDFADDDDEGTRDLERAKLDPREEEP